MSIRVCPGRELADASLWIVCALTLATMKIGKPFGAGGSELKSADIVYTSTMIRWGANFNPSFFSFSSWPSLTGIFSHPPAFRCHIEPRSTAASEMLERRAAVLAQSAGIEDTEL